MEKDAKRESRQSFLGGPEKVVSVRGILTKNPVRGCVSMNEWIHLEILQVREGWTRLSSGLLISSVYMKQPEVNMRKGLKREQVNLGLCQGNIRDLKIQSVGKFFPVLYVALIYEYCLNHSHPQFWERYSPMNPFPLVCCQEFRQNNNYFQNFNTRRLLCAYVLHQNVCWLLTVQL